MPNKQINKLAIAIVVSIIVLAMNAKADIIPSCSPGLGSTDGVWAISALSSASAEPSSWSLMLIAGALAALFEIARRHVRM